MTVLRALGVLAGYAVIGFMGLALLGGAVGTLTELDDSERGVAIPVAAVAGLIGVAGGVIGVLYEVRAVGSERLRRHAQGQLVSLVILAIAIVLLLVWPATPLLLRIAALTFGAGFMLGFLGAFIPNRRRALAIRDLSGRRDLE